MTTTVHAGGHLWSRCADCGKLVRLTKPILGDLHLCLTTCELRGHHGATVRRGPFWARRNECADCSAMTS